jgi:hypothetical protein
LQLLIKLDLLLRSLRNNKEIVLVAVKNDGWALKYASDELKNDKEVVLTAVTQNDYGLKFASENLRNDKYFLYEIDQIKKITKQTPVYDCLSKNIQDKIDKNPDYLLKFETVNLKPART